MRKNDIESTVASVAIQQRLAEFFYELDVNDGVGVADFYTEDGVFLVAGNTHAGRDVIARFYAERVKRIRSTQKDGMRTARHLALNARMLFDDQDNARVGFVVLYFSGEGKPPLFDATTPSVVSDCQMEFRRESDGVWRIAMFASQPVFVGDDPFMKQAILKR